ncbi:MAG: efflux RND transporter periplasmic adaptor subunit [Bacteroidales bacterium]|nr:efflux RND transporter periplasmic adaptor subunit [Bacteroidales bacterium]HPD95736.1 efflux RND transporter periplasmic adaptor subunit [Tenuifilaceae bacterium]HRX31612.1 efflux RND transporter periplasmic adaptor subunit [Tenuifilaceae bacterium]
MDRVIERKKGIKRKHIYWAIGGLIFIALLAKLIFGNNSSAFRTSADRLTISTVEQGSFNDYITVIGQVEPISTIYLDAEEGGRVKELLIEEGAMVKKGNIILKLENKQLYQTILNSEAALAEKENYLRNTRINFETELIQSKRNILDNEYRLARKKRNFEQNQSLYKEGLIAKEDYLQAQEDYDYEVKLLDINKMKAKNDSMIRVTSMKTLETDLTQMREMLKLVHERIDNLNVKATVDGQLGMLDAEVGQSISQGQRIGQINVLTNFKVNAKIDEHYIDQVRRNLPATLERNDNTYKLLLKKVYPEVRDGQFRVDLVFDGKKPDNVRTGQSYHINLELGDPEKAIMIPRGAFFQSTGGQWIFVLNEDGTEAVKRSIKIGRQNPKYYEVLEGLQPGEKVITSSYDLFGDNERLLLR